MKLERISIPAGEVTLAGLLYSPREDTRRPCLVVSHGFTASKESVDLLAAYLCQRGFHCVTFDFRGHKLGGSTGDLNHAAETIADLEAAVEFAKHRIRRENSILVGHSMGALVSLVVGARRTDVIAVAAITTGPKPSAGFHQPIGLAMLQQRTDYVSGAPPMQILEEFDRLAADWKGLGDRPSLFVAARGDGVVKPSRVREMTDRAGPRAEYQEIDGSHLEAPSRARGIVANWLESLER